KSPPEFAQASQIWLSGRNTANTQSIDLKMWLKPSVFFGYSQGIIFARPLLRESVRPHVFGRLWTGKEIQHAAIDFVRGLPDRAVGRAADACHNKRWRAGWTSLLPQPVAYI